MPLPFSDLEREAQGTKPGCVSIARLHPTGSVSVANEDSVSNCVSDCVSSAQAVPNSFAARAALIRDRGSSCDNKIRKQTEQEASSGASGICSRRCAAQTSFDASCDRAGG